MDSGNAPFGIMDNYSSTNKNFRDVNDMKTFLSNILDESSSQLRNCEISSNNTTAISKSLTNTNLPEINQQSTVARRSQSPSRVDLANINKQSNNAADTKRNQQFTNTDSTKLNQPSIQASINQQQWTNVDATSINQQSNNTNSTTINQNGKFNKSIQNHFWYPGPLDRRDFQPRGVGHPQLDQPESEDNHRNMHLTAPACENKIGFYNPSPEQLAGHKVTPRNMHLTDHTSEDRRGFHNPSPEQLAGYNHIPNHAGNYVPVVDNDVANYHRHGVSRTETTTSIYPNNQLNIGWVSTEHQREKNIEYAILIPKSNPLERKNDLTLKTQLAKLVATVLRPQQIETQFSNYTTNVTDTASHQRSSSISYDVAKQTSFTRRSNINIIPPMYQGCSKTLQDQQQLVFYDDNDKSFPTSYYGRPLTTNCRETAKKKHATHNGSEQTRIPPGTYRDQIIQEQDMLDTCLSQRGKQVCYYI